MLACMPASLISIVPAPGTSWCRSNAAALAVFLRHSGHRGDDFDGERSGEVLHDVELVGIGSVQVFVDEVDDCVVLRFNGPRREGLIEQAAHVTVFRRIHENDGLLLR